MNHEQRHKFRSLLAALYPQEQNMGTTRDGIEVWEGRPVERREDQTRMFNVPAWAVGQAVKQAEMAVDQIVAQLRDAEATCADLARQIGAQQDMIDRLEEERERRSKLLRELISAGRGPDNG